MFKELSAGLVALSFVAALSACSSDPDGSAEKKQVCAPGKTEACACVGAAMTGAQTCGDSGEAWGKCVCPGDSVPGGGAGNQPAECAIGATESCSCGAACGSPIQRTCNSEGRWGICVGLTNECNSYLAMYPETCAPHQ